MQSTSPANSDRPAVPTKPIASISLDLDDEWTYLKTRGDPAWLTYPSYLQSAVPRILDFLDDAAARITFFLVAQDASFDYNRDVIAEIARRGHEIGNHTFHHDPWLQTYTQPEIDEELARAEECIQTATGVLPRGFRGPGFSFSPAVLTVLARRGYQYDATTFPNILNPLARFYFLSSTDLTEEELDRRKGLYGKWTDGFRSNKAYEWVCDDVHVVEIPVTTMPFLKVPIHASYILYLSTWSSGLGLAYFKFALRMCRLTATLPSILLHPLDFIGRDDTDSLSFFPAMRLESDVKLVIMREMFGLLASHHRLVTMSEHAAHVRARGTLRRKMIRI